MLMIVLTGEQSFDEVYHKISGGREGTITDVREDGQICTVRWAPGEDEHQYRTGSSPLTLQCVFETSGREIREI